VDYDETFNSVVKPTTIHSVLTLALSRGWLVHQLDVKNTFLHDTLTKAVYCSQPMNLLTPLTLSLWADSTSPSTA
jgi:hypothetical protein